MRLSISNIGWIAEQDETIYNLMKKYGYSGLEIAPTRIFPENPYDRLEEAKLWARNLKQKHGFVIPSMQSIWYGRQERIFGPEEEREILLDYTKKAINFAAAIGCRNLVFGCPRNRNSPDGADRSVAVSFFKELGEYAVEKGTVIGMEANPAIYNTNYINDTISALNLIENVDSAGFLLNLDVGTMIQNGEFVEELVGKVCRINHVHISEPGLKPIEERMFHKKLRKILKDEKYQGWVSVEMAKSDDIRNLEKSIKYIKERFE